MNEDQLKIRILGRGLSESLFHFLFGHLFHFLFGHLEVFDTPNNMLHARKNTRSAAVSLDGGLIRKPRNQYQLGSREDPVVWFLAVQQHLGSSSKQRNLNLIPRPVQRTMTTTTTAKQTAEVKRKRERARQRYFEAEVEADILKCSDILECTKLKLLTLSN